MDSDIPTLLVLFGASILNNPEQFFNEFWYEVKSGKEGFREELMRNVDNILEHYKVPHATNPSVKSSDAYPDIIQWHSRNVTAILLNRLFRMAQKANEETPETLVVLDRPADPDQALVLVKELHAVAEKLNTLDCFIKVKFALIGHGIIHEI